MCRSCRAKGWWFRSASERPTASAISVTFIQVVFVRLLARKSYNEMWHQRVWRVMIISQRVMFGVHVPQLLEVASPKLASAHVFTNDCKLSLNKVLVNLQPWNWKLSISILYSAVVKRKISQINAWHFFAVGTSEARFSKAYAPCIRLGSPEWS